MYFIFLQEIFILNKKYDINTKRILNELNCAEYLNEKLKRNSKIHMCVKLATKVIFFFYSECYVNSHC